MASIPSEAALQLIQSMADHIQKSLTDLGEIQPPQVKHEQNIAQINALLHQCFERLCDRPAGDTSDIKNEIVQYSGERKLLEINGPREAENACRNQVAAVMQALSDRLVATLPLTFFDRSRQNLATGVLQPYVREKATGQMEPRSATGTMRQESHHLEPPADDLYEMQQATGKTECRNHQWHEQNEDQAESSMEGLELNSTVATEQRSDNERTPSAFTRPDHERAAHDNCDATLDAIFLKIIDADGICRGGLKQVDTSGSRRVDSILKRPIKRPVQLRRGRAFSSDHLNAICKNGVKIVSCMIQASGEVMENRCTFCRQKSQGPFNQCIMVRDDAVFRRCGNCEWVRGRCQGASTATETQMTSATNAELALDFPEEATRHFELSLAQEQSESPAKDSHTTNRALTDDTLQSGASAKSTPLVRAEATFSKVPDMHWKIHQIKTRNCASAASTDQLWTWCEEEGSLKHLLLSNRQWMHLQCPADFDVKLKDVAEVRASVQSWRVRLVMNEPATHEQQEAPREDVMVVFEGRTTVQCFLQFCHDQNVAVSEQEPPVMVAEWRDMASEYTLAGEV